MNCEICEWLKVIVKRALDTSLHKEFLEVRRLARSHYRRFHPNPFDVALDEDEFGNLK